MPEKRFESYIRTVKADLYRYRCATGLKGFLKCYFGRPGFRYTFWMRSAGYLSKTPLLKILYWMASFQLHRLEIKYGISISHTTKIGGGLCISHFGGIVVNDSVSIGRNRNLSHGVTIGQTNRGKYKGCPRIGDGVYIGPLSCIIGAVSIGSNVAIGAHAVVVRDVSNNEVVVGNPARAVSADGAKEYVNWVPDDDHGKRELSNYERKGL